MIALPETRKNITGSNCACPYKYDDDNDDDDDEEEEEEEEEEEDNQNNAIHFYSIFSLWSKNNLQKNLPSHGLWEYFDII